ncbi:hypothetical protein MCOR07_005256 [Pyricularia oryzae]|nr:hypothetical protein MCOR01_011484 [Pyricularia oryzae]KAI6262652.1 hypothetical protein MCOR19_001160 [Pyricularia oryzae]KAI6329316.1 hypothetical protein MCOR30_005693 [Pyricularia oryzae]KAI6367094.1 hypothetical protein MCOR31_006172 [Pyricularia oryzae]KAI6399361.1 hypothetical protein MCOR23_005331 [Pyricularia oryzae]
MSPEARRQLCQEQVTLTQASDNPPRPRYPQSPVPLPAVYAKAIERWNADKSFQARVESVSLSPSSAMSPSASKDTKVKFSSPSATTVLGTGKTTGSGIIKRKKKDKKEKGKAPKESKNTNDSEESQEVSNTVVKLEGPHNIDKWHTSLKATLGPLHHFVTRQFEELVRPAAEDVAARRQWDADKKSAGKTLKSSLKKVKNLLKDRLEKSVRDRNNPYKYYSAVMQAMRAEADRSNFTSTLVEQVCDLKVADFDNLAAYQRHIQELRCKLALLGAYPGDRFMVLAAVNGLGTTSLTEGMLRVLIAPPAKSDGVKDPSAMSSIPE